MSLFGGILTACTWDYMCQHSYCTGAQQVNIWGLANIILLLVPESGFFSLQKKSTGGLKGFKQCPPTYISWFRSLKLPISQKRPDNCQKITDNLSAGSFNLCWWGWLFIDNLKGTGCKSGQAGDNRTEFDCVKGYNTDVDDGTLSESSLSFRGKIKWFIMNLW